MSFCSNCGAEIEGDASFCAQCGTPVAKPETAEANAQESSATDAQQSAPAVKSETSAAAQTTPTPGTPVPPPGQSQAATASEPSAAASVPQPAPSAAAADPSASAAPQPTAAATQAAPAPAAAPAPQPQPQPVQTNNVPPQNQQVYAQGCVSAAWSDITKSKGWFGKVALMALIQFIPILNWIIPGYCMRWSRQLAFGKVQEMPKSIFCNRAFINGVFAFVIGLVIAIVLWICNMILGFIPFLGWIAIIVLAFFAIMFEYLCYMRAAVADSLGAGFQIGKIWETFTRNLGSLFCAAVLPNLIIGIIAGIVVLIVVSIGFAIVFGGSIFELISLFDSLNSSSYYSSSRASMYAAQLIVQLILSMIPAILIGGYLANIGTSLSYLLTFRAMGHWVSRYAPDWATDPMVTATAHVYDTLETPQQAQPAQQPPTPPTQQTPPQQ